MRIRPVLALLPLLISVWAYNPVWRGNTCAFGQSSDYVGEPVKNMVVLVRSAASHGAGIIFGLDSSYVYIATADHVIARSRDSVQISFYFAPAGNQYRAEWTGKSDVQLDMAVLRVNIDALYLPPDSLVLDWLGEPRDLDISHNLHVVGHPGGQLWFLNRSDLPFDRRDGHDLVFQITDLRRGYSGGALLNEQGLLVGLIKVTGNREGVALSTERLLERLRQWRFPISLVKPPRKGRGTLRTLLLTAGPAAIVGGVLCLAVLCKGNGPDGLPLPPGRPPP